MTEATTHSHSEKAAGTDWLTAVQKRANMIREARPDDFSNMETALQKLSLAVGTMMFMCIRSTYSPTTEAETKEYNQKLLNLLRTPEFKAGIGTFIEIMTGFRVKEWQADVNSSQTALAKAAEIFTGQK